jgi:ribosomal protein L11 methyltransferase
MIRLAIRVRAADAEIVLAELLDLAPDGLEESAHDDLVEFAIYGAPGEVPELPAVEATIGGRLVDVSTTTVPDDWRERWKVWHRPVDVSWRFRRLRVRPPWEPPLRESADHETIELVIDPGQAFGTGAHATTRLCLELLLRLEPHEGPFADWGCGSGVLSLAAAKLGYAPVLGIDVEPESLLASEENAAANGVAFEVRRHNLRTQPAPYAPTVAANLVRPLLLMVADRLEDPPETLIVSGLLREEADEIAQVYGERFGYRETERLHGVEWAALLLLRG